MNTPAMVAVFSLIVSAGQATWTCMATSVASQWQVKPFSGKRWELSGKVVYKGLGSAGFNGAAC